MAGRRKTVLSVAVCVLLAITWSIAGYRIAEKYVANATILQPQRDFVSYSGQNQTTADYGTQIAATIQALHLPGRVLFQSPVPFGESGTNDDSVRNTEVGLILTATNAAIPISATVSRYLTWNLDASVVVEAINPDPCDGWSYSLDIRQPENTQADTSFYRFKVFNNHLWLFGRYDEHQSAGQAIAYGKLNQNFDMHQPNTLRLAATDQHFNFYINDEKIGSGDDPEGPAPQAGNYGVGVSVETCSGPASALFTNFLVLTAS